MIHLEVLEHGIVVVVGPSAAGVGQQVNDADVSDIRTVWRFAVFLTQHASRTEDQIILSPGFGEMAVQAVRYAGVLRTQGRPGGLPHI
jgi:hypothetical protein